MTKLLKSLFAASFLVTGTTALMAQSSPGTGTGGATGSGTPSATTAPGEVKDQKPTDPNLPRQPEVKKLEKDQRMGNESKGN
jgi:hypothetical protein